MWSWLLRTNLVCCYEQILVTTNRPIGCYEPIYFATRADPGYYEPTYWLLWTYLFAARAKYYEPTDLPLGPSMVTGNQSLLPQGLPDNSFVNAISNFYSPYFFSHLHFPNLLVSLNALQQEKNNFLCRVSISTSIPFLIIGIVVAKNLWSSSSFSTWTRHVISVN